MSLLAFVMWLVMMQQENNGTIDSVLHFNTELPRTFTICGKSGCGAEPPLVTVSLEDGKATFGPKFTQDEASRVFWTNLAYQAPCKKAQTITGHASPSWPDHVEVNSRLWRAIEEHCVAVLTEKHVEKRPVATYGQPLPEVSKDGEEIIHVPEQTLKLRCK